MFDCLIDFDLHDNSTPQHNDIS